eukprot:m.280795 g.280795  ORF g.280795 m.280795 type:complete len:54 (-) comp19829_c4_seq1:10-171(-)
MYLTYLLIHPCLLCERNTPGFNVVSNHGMLRLRVGCSVAAGAVPLHVVMLFLR